MKNDSEQCVDDNASQLTIFLRVVDNLFFLAVSYLFLFI